MVDSVTIPGGTDLYAGPDPGAAKVGVVPAHDSILAAEPVVWRGTASGPWLAFYLSCGGHALYWVSVGGLEHQNPSAGSVVATQITELKKATPYTTSGQASMLPIVVNDQQHLVFESPKVAFAVGRGELTGLPG
jgi:hypothetical protein